MTDDLTGLHNLRSFESRLARLVMESERTGIPMGLFVLDVDRLKSLNDAHGHLTGAAAVRAVGHLIRFCAPPEATACRYGGDEFVVVIPRCSRTDARRWAECLRAEVSSMAPILDGVAFPSGTLTISIGAECTVPAGASRDPRQAGEALFAAADRALYSAKAGGRDCVQFAAGTPTPLSAVRRPTHQFPIRQGRS
jgi:diguanylate cyclase (GGDEF)-like protein